MEILESARVAANWWKNSIENPKQQDVGSNGNQTGMLIEFLSTILRNQERNKIDNTILNNFINTLQEEITKEISKNGNCILQVDYFPIGLLGEVARKSNLSNDIFPYKTYMNVEKNQITVKAGASANTEIIYSDGKKGSQQISKTEEKLSK